MASGLSRQPSPGRNGKVKKNIYIYQEQKPIVNHRRSLSKNTTTTTTTTTKKNTPDIQGATVTAEINRRTRENKKKMTVSFYKAKKKRKKRRNAPRRAPLGSPFDRRRSVGSSRTFFFSIRFPRRVLFLGGLKKRYELDQSERRVGVLQGGRVRRVGRRSGALIGRARAPLIRSRAGRPIKAVDRRPARRTPIDPIRRGDWSRRPLCRTPLSDWSVRCFPGANPKSLLGRGRGLVSSPTRNELRLYFVDVRVDRWRVFTVRRFVIYGPSAHTVMSIEWHETTSTPSHSISTHAARGNTPARPDKMKHKKKTGKADPLSIHFQFISSAGGKTKRGWNGNHGLEHDVVEEEEAKKKEKGKIRPETVSTSHPAEFSRPNFISRCCPKY